MSNPTKEELEWESECAISFKYETIGYKCRECLNRLYPEEGEGRVICNCGTYNNIN